MQQKDLSNRNKGPISYLFINCELFLVKKKGATVWESYLAVHKRPGIKTMWRIKKCEAVFLRSDHCLFSHTVLCCQFKGGAHQTKALKAADLVIIVPFISEQAVVDKW